MKKQNYLRLIILPLLFSLSCSAPETKAEKSTTEGERLNRIITEYANSQKHQDAFEAPYFNVEENLSQFGDFPTPEYFARAKKRLQTAISSLQEIHPDTLSFQDQLAYRLFKEDVETHLKDFNFPRDLLTVDQMENRLHEYLDESSQALTDFPFDSVKHYQDFIKRAEGFPVYVDNQIAALQRGIKEKIVLSCLVAKKVPGSYREGMTTDIEKNPFFRPIGFMPKEFPTAEKNRLAAEFRKMIKDRIIPGFTKFDQFFRNEYLSHCREEFGIGTFPRGAEWYQQSILHGTGLTLDPKEIHAIGEREVARISAEIEKVKKQVHFKGTKKAFLKSLSQDPKYFFKTAPEMLQSFQNVKKKVDAKIGQYFSLMPKSEYKIVEASSPTEAAGSYKNPTEILPYGRFVVNTKNLRSVANFGVTTLSLHEAVPGHHFQLALQFEMKDQLSEYQRKMYWSNAFGEGWALYAEYLGNEMGLFDDPLQRMGNLNDEMLRAVRLVVDTGIHSMNWSQKKAIDYMSANMASDAKEVENEINRYSVWPGQALGYKIGQLKIIELRKKAEKELGPKFDLKEFHRAVIGHGTVSLSILESQVNDWMSQAKNH